MRHSKITLVKELNIQLMKVHSLANLMEKKDSLAIVNFRNWLFESEKLMEKFNRPEVSKLAVIRAELSNYLPQNTARNKKKELFHFSSNLLSKSQDVIWDTSTLFSEKTEQAKELILQLLNLIYQSGAFQFDQKQDFTIFLENIWSFCTNHEQLRGITIQIISLINKSDVLLVMAENIDLEKLQ